MNEEELRQFLEKLASGEYTNEEYRVFVTWVENCTRKEYQQLLTYWETIVDTRDIQEAVNSSLIEKIEAGLDKIDAEEEAPAPLYPEIIKVRPMWPRIAAAASVLLLIGTGAYFLRNHNRPSATSHDVAPFSAMAILKTGGKTILLDKTKNGRIAQTVVTKSVGEQLAYSPASEPAQAVYDTIQIPAGGRPYTVQLSDGSKITLNAATILRFPESFSKTRREQVELISGEIYADIVHNPQAPLQVKAPGQLIEDIGTQFDINAYNDDPDKRTTLIQGAININQRKLKPGQQAVLTATTFDLVSADIDQVTAWKDGDFSFNGEHIDAIMRQLARWYNIEVVYEGAKTDEVFYGRITRKKNISEVLRMLEKTQKIHFKIEGRRVTVLSKK